MTVELSVIVGIALAVAAVAAIILPLRANPDGAIEDTSMQADLMARRESAYQVLRDLDSDFEAGKLSEEDYRPMRVQSLAQAAEIVAQLDAARVPVSNQAEITSKRVVVPMRARQDVDQYCPQCGASRGPDDVFCRKCGRALT
jgi:zinc-ribbon domain